MKPFPKLMRGNTSGVIVKMIKNYSVHGCGYIVIQSRHPSRKGWYSSTWAISSFEDYNCNNYDALMKEAPDLTQACEGCNSRRCNTCNI